MFTGVRPTTQVGFLNRAHESKLRKNRFGRFSSSTRLSGSNQEACPRKEYST
jgi:hypothetical protein